MSFGSAPQSHRSGQPRNVNPGHLASPRALREERTAPPGVRPCLAVAEASARPPPRTSVSVSQARRPLRPPPPPPGSAGHRPKTDRRALVRSPKRPSVLPVARYCSTASRSGPTPTQPTEADPVRAVEPVGNPSPRPKARYGAPCGVLPPHASDTRHALPSGARSGRVAPEGPTHQRLQLAWPTEADLGLAATCARRGLHLPKQASTVDGTRCVVSSATLTATEVTAR
jgi:hypothetical protein